MTTRIVTAALGLLLLACTGSNETRESLPIIRLYEGQHLLEERIVDAKVIARVMLRSHEVVGAQFPGSSEYLPAIKFTFDALEYLKGSGGGELVAYAYGDHDHFALERDTAKKAKDKWGSWISEYRDGRWDDREAVIFLRQPVANGPYVIGFLGEYRDSFTGRRVVRRVTVADEVNRAWLPDAAAPSGAQRSPASEQRFLLEDPGGPPSSGGQSRSADPLTISKSSLEARIAAVEAELAANNTDAYRDCLLAKYDVIRGIREKKARGLQSTNNYDLGSGVASDTRVDSHGWSGYTIEREWYEGRDKDLFTPRQNIMYTNRPLPAGEYRVYYNFTEPGQDCGYPEEQRTELLEIVTVTAPAGTLAESFFDPVADGAAVTSTTTVGTIGWESGEVEATLTQDVTGHILDFIALDGTVSLSLAVADAAEDAGTLSWTVASQPWNAGDKMMLRVRKAPAPPGVTVTLSPREEQYSTGTDITIEWSDPDGCDSHYFVGVYNNEELYRVERILGSHPAPATTTLSADLNLSWDRVPSHDWWVGVHCAPDDGSEWRVVGKASLQWGLPSATEPPAITIADLGATLANGQSDGFTVSASNLDATASYTIRVTTDDADLGFDGGCTDRQEDVTVPAESTSHTAALTLHGCATPGGTVTATLLSGGATIDTATQDVTVVPSTDATLRSLALSGVALTFDPAVTGYTAAVANTVTETTVTPTANDDGATSVIKLGGVADADGTVPLSVGGNVITIEVTAEDGNTARTYTITVTRAAAAAAPPGTPDRPSGERTGPGAVSLDWNDVPTATSYDVMFWLVAVNGFVQLSPDNAVHSISITFNGSSAAVTGLSTTGHDGWYAFVVRAVNDAGASGWSGNNRIPVPPDTPDRPSGERTGPGAVSLDWNDVPTATSYVVEFWRDGAYVQLSADAAVHGISIAFDGSSAAVTGLPTVGYQWYFFRVRAVNAGGASGWSPNNAIAVSS